MSFIKTYGRCYQKFPENNSNNKYLGYEYVDLGLPSGRKWATMNFGANNITDYGLYFQWGDTQGYEISNTEKEFSGSDYKYFDTTTGQYTKYNETDNKKILDLEDNAVCAILGGNWKIPSPEDFLELQENTTYSFVFNYQESGINGVLLTSNINGNTLFFPAGGQRAYNISGSSAGVLGYYLSNSLYNIIQLCACMYFNPGSVTFNSSTGRTNGCTIRPVF